MKESSITGKLILGKTENIFVSNMVIFFIKLYSSLNDSNHHLNRFRIFSLFRYFTRKIANIVLPAFYRVSPKKYLPQNSKGSPRIIVSFTSFPQRINKVWLVIETIFRQTIKPDKIILWLSVDQFPHVDAIPESLKRMQKRGLTIEFCEGDIRSHKKYFYAFQKYPNDYIITIDDDIFYREDFIETLIRKQKSNNEAIVCNYAYEIVYNNDLTLAPYRKWKLLEEETEPSGNIFFGSGGGVLFPPGFADKRLLNIELIMKLCPLSDDIWLNIMVRLQCMMICKAKGSSTILPVINKSDVQLAQANVYEGKNDEQLAAVQEFFKNLGYSKIFEQ